MKLDIQEHRLLRAYDVQGEVVIPAEVEVIGGEAFRGTDASSVVLHDRVREIGHGAFAYCRSLSDLTLGRGLEKICYGAFFGCGALTSLSIPEGITHVGSAAFLGCDALKEVRVPYALSEKTFSWWENCFGELLTYRIGFMNPETCPKLLTRIKNCHQRSTDVLLLHGDAEWLHLFLSLWKKEVPLDLLQSLTARAQEMGRHGMVATLLEYTSRHYPRERIEAIEKRNVEKAMGLRPMTVADWRRIFEFSVTNRTEITLDRYLGTDRTLYLPTCIGGRAVTSLSPYAFRRVAPRLDGVLLDADNTAFSYTDGVLYSKDAEKLLVLILDREVLEVPYGTRVIGIHSCRNARLLQRLILPETVEVIEQFAFSDCTSLREVVLPRSLERLEDPTFYGCRSLKAVYYRGTRQEWEALNHFAFVKYRVICEGET